MKRAVFLDRDGVIVHDRGYVHKAEDLELLEGAGEAIRRFNEARLLVIIISNQAGVARGYFNEDDVNVFNKALTAELKKKGAHIDAIYFCPHHPTEGTVKEYSLVCECRKPKAGMILAAAKDHGISLQGSWMIGDRQSDVEAGKKAACRTILLGKDARNLHDAASIILDGKEPLPPNDKLVLFNEVGTLAEELRKQKKKTVFTNGCFDLLHAGHAYYLNEARKKGDVLIVGLNSDRSVRKIKGKDRPINNELERAYVLSALAAVGYVIIFDEDVPLLLVEMIRPDVYVKGSDWRGKGIPEEKIVQKYGGIVEYVPLAAGFSSTNIIEKIKKG